MITAVASAAGRIRHLLSDNEETLVECLVRHANVTAEEAGRLISFGAVYLDRERVTSNQPVLAGQYVRVHLQPRRFPAAEITWPTTIVDQTDEFVVINKPAGIPVHASVDNAVENVLHQLSNSLGVPLHITQRLDNEVSGLLVLAKTKQFQREFNAQLVERKVKKRYRALVTVAPAIGRHVHYMQPSKRSPKTVSTWNAPGAVECVLSVLAVQRTLCASYFDIEIDLETGRTHQIRAQLSAIGSPIVGDAVYGSQASYQVNGETLPGIALFSASTSWSTHESEYSFALVPPWMLL